MKRILLAITCLLLVLGAAIFRPRFSPTTRPLPASPRGVTLIAVEGLGMNEAKVAFARTAFSGYGLMPTRNGTPDEGDFDAGLRMILSGSRFSTPDDLSLTEAARTKNLPFRLLTFSGTDSVANATDAVVKRIAPDGLPEGSALLIVGVTPPGAALRRRERVAPVLFWSRNARAVPELLTSPSTRNRPGLIAATDIAATVIDILAPGARGQRFGDGRPITTVTTDDSDASINDLFRKATLWGLQAREQKLLQIVPWILAGLFALAVFVPATPARRAACATVLSTPLALVVSAPLVPASGFPDYFVYLIAAVPVAGVTALAFFSEDWGDRLPRLLAVATSLILAADTCVGGYLLSRTPLSYSVLEAARFYGIGNEISGLFLGAAVVAVGTNQGAVATILWGLTAAVILGAPALGADAGGFVAALIAFTTLAVVARRKEVDAIQRRKRGLVFSGIAIILIIAAFALWDGSRPPSSRTHLGEAVATAQENGFDRINAMATRKISVNVRLLTSSPWAVLLWVQVAVIVWSINKAKRQEPFLSVPALQAMLTTLTATMLTLFALNDSGVVAGAMCGCWVLGVGYWVLGGPAFRDAADGGPKEEGTQHPIPNT